MNTRALLIVPLLTLACAEGDLEDGLGWLDLPDDVLGRVDLPTLGAVRLHPDGPVVADGQGDAPWSRWADRDPETAAWSLDVVAAEERLGVRVPGGPNETIELVLWVDREDAVAWTVAPTAGGSSRGAGGVSVAPGVAVDVLDTWDGHHLVEIVQRGVVIEAWVPAGDVDQVRDVPEVRALVAIDEGESAWLRVPGEILDAPGGRWLAAFDAHGPEHDPDWVDDPVAVRRLGPAEGGWVPVAWGGAGVRVDGWVSEDALTSRPLGLRGWGSGGAWSSMCGGWGPRATLRGGALLHDGQEGAVVGEVLEDTRLPVERVGEPWSDGWREVEVWTAWGLVPVWVGPGEIAF